MQEMQVWSLGLEDPLETEVETHSSILPWEIQWIWSLGLEDPLETEVETHSSILPWEIQWTEEPGGLQSVESDMT